MMVIVILLTLLGAYCVSGLTSKKRFIGFSLYTVTNVCWLIYVVGLEDLWLIIQMSLFMVFSIKGMINNWPSHWKKPWKFLEGT